MGIRLEIDKNACMSSGNCVAGLPEAFAFDEDSLAEARPGAGALPLARLLAAARRCPAMAIALYAANGDEIDVAR